MSEEKQQQTPEAEAPEAKKVEHKVGLHRYAMSGSMKDDYVVIGAPRIQGKRWVTLAHHQGGPVKALPEDRFEIEFWIPNLGDQAE